MIVSHFHQFPITWPNRRWCTIAPALIVLIVDVIFNVFGSIAVHYNGTHRFTAITRRVGSKVRVCALTVFAVNRTFCICTHIFATGTAYTHTHTHRIQEVRPRRSSICSPTTCSYYVLCICGIGKHFDNRRILSTCRTSKIHRQVDSRRIHN